MTGNPRAGNGSRKRMLAAFLAAVLAISGLVLVSAQTAGAAPQTVTTGSLTWGVKTSFRNYITGAIAHGTITTSGGVTQNPDGTFNWPAASSSTFDSAAATPTASFAGSVQFVGHDGLLDMTISNVRIVRNGTAGTIVADVVSRPFQGTNPPSTPPLESHANTVLADLVGGTYGTTGTSASWSGATADLTPAGSTAFGGFYPADESIDPVSYGLTLQAAPVTPDPATGALVWKLSNQAWTASSLAPAKAVGAPAVLGSDAWGFPVAGSVSYDPATKATTLPLGGSLTIGNTAQGNYRITLANPTIEVTADGAGTLVADVSYCLSGGGNTCPTTGYNTPVRVTVVTFTLPDASVTDTGSNVSWTVTPDYPLQGNATFPTFGQFPQPFIDALAASLQGHFRDTSSGTPPAPAAANAQKPPAPLVVSFDYTPVTPEPEGVTQDITTEVLESGGLTISVAGTTVVLPSPMPTADATVLRTTGAINPVTVTDLRLANPGWSANGQVSDFARSGGGGTIDGAQLGWTPSVTSSSAGQTVTPGGAVVAGAAGGLKVPSILGTAPAGAGRGTAVFGAGLTLKVPTTVAPGTYNATLTLTVM